MGECKQEKTVILYEKWDKMDEKRAFPNGKTLKA